VDASAGRRVLALAVVALAAFGCTAPETRTGTATWYHLDGQGNCSFPDYPGADTAFVAMNAVDYGTADLCGATLSVTGPQGAPTTVKVVDQCPECPSGNLDLSPQAFAAVADGDLDRGVVPVQWRIISGPASPAIGIRVKENASPYWMELLVLDHRNPVRSLEVRPAGGDWVPLVRREYNYFGARDNRVLGAGPFEVRVTDTFGESLVAGGILPQSGRVFRTTAQFAPH
jgi:expansin (peptidoglycan-binding protein)